MYAILLKFLRPSLLVTCKSNIIRLNFQFIHMTIPKAVYKYQIWSTSILPSFCKRKHLKMFPFVKIDIFILIRCSRSGKIFKSQTRLVCELSIISINNFAKGNIFILTITLQQLFFTMENLKILDAAVIVAGNAIFND